MVSVGQGREIRGPKSTCVPDFDRLVDRSGHNLRAIGREGDRADDIAMGVGLLRLEIQRSCQTSQEASVSAKRDDLRPTTHPNPRL